MEEAKTKTSKTHPKSLSNPTKKISCLVRNSMIVLMLSVLCRCCYCLLPPSPRRRWTDTDYCHVPNRNRQMAWRECFWASGRCILFGEGIEFPCDICRSEAGYWTSALERRRQEGTRRLAARHRYDGGACRGLTGTSLPPGCVAMVQRHCYLTMFKSDDLSLGTDHVERLRPFPQWH